MRIKLMIICLTLLCGYAKAQTRGGDSSPPLPKEISAEMFDKAVGLIKEFEGAARPYQAPVYRLWAYVIATREPDGRHYRRAGGFVAQRTSWSDTSISESMGKMLFC